MGKIFSKRVQRRRNGHSGRLSSADEDAQVDSSRRRTTPSSLERPKSVPLAPERKLKRRQSRRDTLSESLEIWDVSSMSSKWEPLKPIKVKTEADVASKLGMSIGRKLGEGGFSVVYALHSTGRRRGRSKVARGSDKFLALKKIDKNKRKSALIGYEAQILAHPFLRRHPGVITFDSCYESVNHYYLVTDMAEITLVDYILKHATNQKLEEWHAKTVTRKLMETVFWLHAHNIVHRDIKCGNIVFKDFPRCLNPILIDFGEALFVGEEDVIEGNERSAGTPAKFPPEIIDKTEHLTFPVLKAGEMWAIGCTVFNMVTGYVCFWGETTHELHDRIKKGFNHSYGKMKSQLYMSQECESFCETALHLDWKERLTTENALQHPWLARSYHTLPVGTPDICSPTPSMENIDF